MNQLLMPVALTPLEINRLPILLSMACQNIVFLIGYLIGIR
jgi:hypothetical protein